MTKISQKLFIALTVCLITICTASADVTTDGFKAPEIKPEGEWVNWVFAIVFVVAIVVAAVMNPKRSHLD